MLFHGQQALDIAQGIDRNGLTQVHIRGRNADIDTGAEDIWDAGATLTQFAAAADVHVSSSSAADTTQTLTINGLDANGNAQTKTVVLAGQTETAVAGTWTCIFSASLSAACAGDVYVYEDDTVVAGVPQTAAKFKAKIPIAALKTFMAVYMIPTGHTGFLVEYSGSHAGIELWRIPALGGALEWLENLNGYRQVPVYLPAGTFIKFRYTAAADNQDVRASATIILRKG
jgi:hypothetical protein